MYKEISNHLVVNISKCKEEAKEKIGYRINIKYYQLKISLLLAIPSPSGL